MSFDALLDRRAYQIIFSYRKMMETYFLNSTPWVIVPLAFNVNLGLNVSCLRLETSLKLGLNRHILRKDVIIFKYGYRMYKIKCNI